MTYKLYYYPNTASLSVHWVLVELEKHGVSHTLQLVDFEKSEQKSPAYLALNPKGRVPTLVIDETNTNTPYTEQSAILLLLSELHPSASLAPPPGHPDRARFLEIYTYITNSLLPALRDWVYADKDGSPEGAKTVRQLAGKRIKQCWEYLNGVLEGREYLVGQGPTIADYLAAATVSWTKWVEGTAMGLPEVKRWCEGMKGRGSWEEVVKREEGWVVREPPFEKVFE